MTPVAVVVPVMRRPQNAARFMESFDSSGADGATVYAVADANDTDTIDAWRATGATVLISSRGHKFANKCQHAYLNTTEPWLLLVGDDVVFHPGWLQAALAAAGDRFHVVATNDLGNPWVMWGKHATHPLVRRSYVDASGNSWDGPGVVACEKYRHAWVDNEWSWKAIHERVFVFAEDSHVEHLHPTWSKGERDAVYDDGIAALMSDGRLFRVRSRRARCT
jgi:hypothetical protein